MQRNNSDYNYFLKADLSEYPELSWVAIFKKKIIAHGRRADVVYKKAQKLHPEVDIPVFQVPPRRLVIY